MNIVRENIYSHYNSSNEVWITLDQAQIDENKHKYLLLVEDENMEEIIDSYTFNDYYEAVKKFDEIKKMYKDE